MATSQELKSHATEWVSSMVVSLRKDKMCSCIYIDPMQGPKQNKERTLYPMKTIE